MIPELDAEDYDSENDIPEETTSILLAAIPAFETARLNLIVQEASKSYLKGVKTAYFRLGEKFISDDVKDDVYSFLKTYKKQINEGYTIIQGEKVYWLRDRTLAERQKIFDIIKTGILGGKNPNVIKDNFEKYFTMQKSQAEAIARTETAYVQERGIEERYKKFGVEKVKWLLGSNPCPECQRYGGKIYTWDELPYSLPRHVRCTCTLAPVIE